MMRFLYPYCVSSIFIKSRYASGFSSPLLNSALTMLRVFKKLLPLVVWSGSSCFCCWPDLVVLVRGGVVWSLSCFCSCLGLVALVRGAATGLVVVETGAAGSEATIGFSHRDDGCRSVSMVAIGSHEGATGCRWLLGNVYGMAVLFTIDSVIGVWGICGGLCCGEVTLFLFIAFVPLGLGVRTIKPDFSIIGGVVVLFGPAQSLILGSAELRDCALSVL